MGLNLRHLLNPAPVTLADLHGERVAVDAYGLFYQYLTMLRDGQGHVLKDAHGNTTSHLIGLISRTQELVEAGVTPVYVLDGPPHRLKQETIEKRVALKKQATGRLAQARADGDLAMIKKSAAATASVSRTDAENAKALLEACGLPVVNAPMDAEAQCAAMTRAGLVQAAASQDYDTLVYGAPRIVRNLTNSQRNLEEILLAAFLIEHGLDRETLVDLACLIGNDFFPGVHGIGAKTAMRLLARHGPLDQILERAAQGKAPRDNTERKVQAASGLLGSPLLQQVREVFLDPPADLQAPLERQAPDVSRIHERLVELHSMSRERADRFACALIDLHEKPAKQPSDAQQTLPLSS